MPKETDTRRWADVEEKTKLWDSMYAQGHYPWDLPYPSQELVATILTLDLPKEARVLDVGCGTGSDVMFLASRGHEVTGLDFSKAALEIAADRLQKAGLRAELVRDDVLNPPFPDESFDFISDRGCYHHIPNEDRPRYASEMTRLLRPGGWLFLRGCGIRDRMWVPVDEEELARLFGETQFEAPRTSRFRYDAPAPINAIMALIRKKA